MEEKPSIHRGHRERVKQEFLKGGLEAFSDVRALELLLFYALPQGDVNPLAHRLLDTFGSLAGVLDAGMEDLKNVPGIGEHAAILLKLVPAVTAKYLASRTSDDFILNKDFVLHKGAGLFKALLQKGIYLVVFVPEFSRIVSYVLCSNNSDLHIRK